MRLYELAGLREHPRLEAVGGGAFDVDRGAWLALLDAGDLYLRAGAPDPTWWATLSTLERRALAEIGNRLAAERGALLAQAIREENGPARLAESADGGRASVSAAVARAALEGLR